MVVIGQYTKNANCIYHDDYGRGISGCAGTSGTKGGYQYHILRDGHHSSRGDRGTPVLQQAERSQVRTGFRKKDAVYPEQFRNQGNRIRDLLN